MICDFLNQKENKIVDFIVDQKITYEEFSVNLEAYFYLSRYLKDISIDYMRAIYKKLKALH